MSLSPVALSRSSPARALDPEAAARRREAELARLADEIARAERKLANGAFVAKAPAAVVQAERDKLARLQTELGRAVNPEQAERYLFSLELFGMRFGLDRMRRLMTALGHPERAYDSIHVVGTNGKSSTVRMIAAILAGHGLRTGAYLSPHLISFTERIRIDDRDLEPSAVCRRGRTGGSSRRAGRSVAARGRPGDAVRGADRRRVLGAGPARGARWR